MDAVEGFERVLLCDSGKIQRRFGLKGWPHVLFLDPDTEEVVGKLEVGKLKSPDPFQKASRQQDIDNAVAQIREIREKARQGKTGKAESAESPKE